MNWYRVTKTIRGRQYDYWQKTYREGGNVKTLNRYIGPSGDNSGNIGIIGTQPCNHVWVDQIVPEGEFVACSKCEAYRRGTAAKFNPAPTWQSPKQEKQSTPGYRTMTSAQRHNARMDHTWDRVHQVSPELFVDMPKYEAAAEQIQSLGGFSKIESMPLPQRNAYGAGLLAGSLALNKHYIYGKAMYYKIDLAKELQALDDWRAKDGNPLTFVNNLMARLHGERPDCGEPQQFNGADSFWDTPRTFDQLRRQARAITGQTGDPVQIQKQKEYLQKQASSHFGYNLDFTSGEPKFKQCD